jgi:hypothetical protein
MKKLNLLNQLTALKKRLNHYLKGIKTVMKKTAIDLIFKIEQIELELENLKVNPINKKATKTALNKGLVYYKNLIQSDNAKVDHDKLNKFLSEVLTYMGLNFKTYLRKFLLEYFGVKTTPKLSPDHLWLLIHELQLELREVD